MTDDSQKSIHQIPLVREFLADHQKMSKLMLNTLVSLEEGDWKGAIRSGRALDITAGPHVLYEESELYPLVGNSGNHMYEEHRAIVTALKTLLDGSRPNELTKREIIDGIRAGIEHADYCGTLVGLLASLPKQKQTASLSRLLAFREEGKAWTERIARKDKSKIAVAERK